MSVASTEDLSGDSNISVKDDLNCEEVDVESECYEECYKLAKQWGMYLTDDCYWSDTRRPYVRLRDYEKLTLTVYEAEGILSDRIIACFSSYLDQAPETFEYALCKCDLSSVKIIADISILRYYHYFQYLNLANNKIEDLSPLSEMPFLAYLDVSHNEISTLLGFKAPYNLTYANFAYNKINDIPCLDEFWSLKVLILSNNNIKDIQGVKNLRYLRVLKLNSNKIHCVENLENLRLSELDLNNNLINSFEQDPELNLTTLMYLRKLDLGNNNITSLESLEGLYNLEMLNLASNNIRHLMELAHLESLRYLVNLKLLGNPVAQKKHYLNVCTYFMKNLQVLDEEYLTPDRKICAEDIENSELSASTERSYLVALQNLYSTEINRHVIPYDRQRKPVILLVGLPGCGVKNMMSELVLAIRTIRRGVGHTTRPKTPLEVDGVDYYFITRSEYENKLSSGDFVTTSNIGGFYYGIDRNEFNKYINQTIMFHTNFESALMLKLKGYSPKLIFCLPKSKQTHMAWLKQNYLYYINEQDYHICVEYNPVAVEEAKSVARNLVQQKIAEEMEQISYEIVQQACEQAEKRNQKQKKKVKTHIRDEPEIHTIVFPQPLETSPEMYTPSKIQLCLLDTPRAPQNSAVGSEYSFDPDDASQMMYSISQMLKSDPHSELEPIEVESKTMVLSVLSSARILKGKCGKICSDIKKQVYAYYNSVMNEREKLLEYHVSNMGIFHDLIYTDNVDESVQRMRKFLATILKYQKTPQEAFKNDPTHQHIIKAKLEIMQRQLELQTSSGEKQKIGCSIDQQVIFSIDGHTDECIKKLNM